MISLRDIITKLRQGGYKVTPQRRAVLRVICSSDEHLTPLALYNKVSKEQSGIGLVTIYRTIGILTELGLICEIHSENNRRSYLLRKPLVHHHHLVCNDCGAVVYFTDCDLSELEERLSRKTGYAIDNHLLEFSGRCQNCQSEA